jgi:uncharacterized protein YggL (DUF469 family)
MSAPCPTFGFHVAMTLAGNLGADAHDVFLDAWIAFLEHRGLYRFAGIGSHRLDFAVAGEGSQATESDRLMVDEWLASRPELRSWRVGELVDLAQQG